MRKLAITTAFAVLALTAAATAAANAPTTTHRAFHLSNPHYLPCPGFWVDGEFDIDRTTTTFSDEAGVPIRTVTHIQSRGTLSNPLNGRSLADSADFKVTVDLVSGERTLDGKVNIATAPGEGVVYQAVGRLAFNPDGSIFEAGQHDDADGTFGALCSYLAGS